MQFLMYSECIKYGSEFPRSKIPPSVYFRGYQRWVGFSWKIHPQCCFIVHILSLTSYHFIITIYFLLNANLPQRIHPAVSHVKVEWKRVGENTYSIRTLPEQALNWNSWEMSVYSDPSSLLYHLGWVISPVWISLSLSY